MTSIRPWGISRPASEKENKKNNLSLIVNMYSTDSLFCSIRMYTPEWRFSQRNGRKQIWLKQLLETIRSEKSGREAVPFIFRREEGFPRWHNDDPPDNAGDAGDKGSVPGSGRSPGGGNGNPLSILAWEIPWTEEPGGLQFMGSQRVRQDWATAQSKVMIKWLVHLHSL